ncbi:odorant receptor 49a-like isoform X1 [Solenopsis invicta]|uniref:odorant receptor 49a-like isoform X1 n=1 Tax=Solenopsis invicta TaxID=13686 RepID=UPI00193C917D|nr:odorant receptor 49a-like isoform X1 [Solenopsis invicta]
MFDDQYYKFNETLLRLLGLWPYGSTKCQRFRSIFLYMLLLSRMIAEFSQLIIVDFNVNVIIKILLNASTALLQFVIFHTIFINSKTLKQALKEVNDNRRTLTDSEEIKILYYYAHQGEKVIFIVLWLVVFVSLTLFISGLLPDIFDFLLPLNESRPHNLLIMAEYQINVGIQYYIFYLYSMISTITALFTTTIILSAMVFLYLHCCAILKICSYRIKQIVDKNVLAYYNKSNIIIERIIRVVELHRKIKKLLKLITTNFASCYLIAFIVGICTIAMSLYTLLNVIKYMHNFAEAVIPTSYIIAYQLCFFILSFMAQLVTNHSDEFSNALYMTLWYEALITIQKSLLFMMIISSKSITVNIGGVCIISMETFTAISKTSMSILTVFLSIQ